MQLPEEDRVPMLDSTKERTEEERTLAVTGFLEDIQIVQEAFGATSLLLNYLDVAFNELVVALSELTAQDPVETRLSYMRKAAPLSEWMKQTEIVRAAAEMMARGQKTT